MVVSYVSYLLGFEGNLAVIYVEKLFLMIVEKLTITLAHFDGVDETKTSSIVFRMAAEYVDKKLFSDD